jgi:hypothetical protein
MALFFFKTFKILNQQQHSADDGNFDQDDGDDDSGMTE